MAIIATTNGASDFALVPQGTHVGICNMVVDLGMQNNEYQGEKSVKHQIYIRWEIPAERMEGKDGPMTIGRFYTLSLHQKAGLRRDLESWRGRGFTKEELDGFDVSKLLGAPAMLNVTHSLKADGTAKANVAGLASIPKGMPKPGKAENPLILYDDDTRDDFDRLPDWIKKKVDERVIKEKPQVNSPQHDADLDDDIPF